MPLTHSWPADRSTHYVSETQAVIDEIVDDIDSLDESLDGLADDVTTLSASVATFDTELDTVSAEVDTLSFVVEGLSGPISGIFNVKDPAYGAAGDGVTDDRASVQAALDAIYAAGGGTLYFPDGTYLIGQRDGFFPSSYKWHLIVYGSNVTITGGANAKVLVTEGHANGTSLFVAVGNWRTPETIGDLQDPDIYLAEFFQFESGFGVYPVYTMDPADAGDIAITLVTEADAANFSVGDAITVRSGQTLDSDGNPGQPDGEMNEVVSIDGDTITLLWPLAKPYVQEYFDSADHTSATTTTPTAYLAPLGIQNVENQISRNLSFVGMNVEVDQDDGQTDVLALHSSLHLRVTDNRIKIKNGRFAPGATYRDVIFSRNHVHIEQNKNADHWFVGDRLSGGVICTDNFFVGTGDYPSFFHINEGCYNWVVSGNHIVNAPVNSPNSPLAIRARGYNFIITDNIIQWNNSGFGGAAYIDDTAVNVITANNLIVSNSDDYPNSNAFGNDALPGRMHGNLNTRGSDAGTTSTDIQVLSEWVYYDSPASIEMTRIPSTGYVVDLKVQVLEAFDGTTPVLRIGDRDGWNDSWFCEDVDLSATGLPTVTRQDAFGHYQIGGAVWRIPEIKYTAGGSTTGKAVIVLMWAQVEGGNNI